MRSSWLAAGLLAVALMATAAADPLVDAVRAGDRVEAAALLDRGADPNATEADGSTALLWAAYREDDELVQRLLAAGADPLLANDYGATPLHEAAIVASTPVIRLLLAAGAPADATNPEGETALMAVARAGNVEAAGELLAAGADVNAVEQWGGQSALMWAAAQSQADMVKFLIEHGADVDARGAVREWQRKITSEPRPKDMHKGGFTPLLYAAREGCTDCARHLIAAGADTEIYDPDRVTPLSVALMNLHFGFAAYLVEAGADVNTWDLFGRTPLYNAIDMSVLPVGGRPDLPTTDEISALDVARMLLDAGADPNIQLNVRPPYRHAVFDRRADHILSTGATPLLRAARGGDNPAIRLLLEHGALVDLPNAMGVTPLMAAASMGHKPNITRGQHKTEDDALESLELLLAAGADINARTRWSKGRWAALADEMDFFRDLPHSGQIALHAAAKKGWNRVVRYLVEHGSDVHVADEEGRTPLDFAMGRYPPAFLDAPPEPLPETVALLVELCEQREGCHIPESDWSELAAVR